MCHSGEQAAKHIWIFFKYENSHNWHILGTTNIDKTYIEDAIYKKLGLDSKDKSLSITSIEDRTSPDKLKFVFDKDYLKWKMDADFMEVLCQGRYKAEMYFDVKKLIKPISIKMD